MKFTTPLTKEEGHIVGYAIVDDADIVKSSKDNTATGDETLAQAQKAIDHWEVFLRATGGALVPNKSHWYYVAFKRVKGIWRYSQFDTTRKLWVRDEYGNTVEMTQVSITEARRTLGVYLAPNGSNVQMKEALLHKARMWAEQIRVGHLGREESWRALRTAILKSIEYPLLSTTFSEIVYRT